MFSQSEERNRPNPKYCGFKLETKTTGKVQINTIKYCVTSPLQSFTVSPVKKRYNCDTIKILNFLQ
jgi:hypothetical protein